jgi:hypothetical protein
LEIINRGIEVVLGVLGVLPTQNIAGEFQYRVLKAAAGAEKGNIRFPGIANRL